MPPSPENQGRAATGDCPTVGFRTTLHSHQTAAGLRESCRGGNHTGVQWCFAGRLRASLAGPSPPPGASVCAGSSVQWEFKPQHLWAAGPGPYPCGYLLMRDTWPNSPTLGPGARWKAGPASRQPSDRGPHPEAVRLLPIEHGVQEHLPRELVDGEHALRLLVHTRTLDAVDDAAQRLLVRFDLPGQSAGWGDAADRRRLLPGPASAPPLAGGDGSVYSPTGHLSPTTQLQGRKGDSPAPALLGTPLGPSPAPGGMGGACGSQTH